MIKLITNQEEIIEFALSFKNDKEYSDPMLSNDEQFKNNLLKSIDNPGSYCTFAVYDKDVMTGLFSFLTIKEEKYLEMLAGLSREKKAYVEMLEYIFGEFPGYKADFVFNPRNVLLESLLKERDAEFETEQIKMLFKGKPASVVNSCVVPYSERYREEYCAIHEDEGMYWTAQKVIDAPEKFHIFLSIKDGKVVGYMDVTHKYEENEPFSLFVSEKYRRMGLGRALLNKALEENYPKRMMLLVEKDNIPAINLYASSGFTVDEYGGCRTAHLVIPTK